MPLYVAVELLIMLTLDRFCLAIANSIVLLPVKLLLPVDTKVGKEFKIYLVKDDKIIEAKI